MRTLRLRRLCSDPANAANPANTAAFSTNNLLDMSNLPFTIAISLSLEVTSVFLKLMA
jgi:hypothetical protein